MGGCLGPQNPNFTVHLDTELSKTVFLFVLQLFQVHLLFFLNFGHFLGILHSKNARFIVKTERCGAGTFHEIKIYFFAFTLYYPATSFVRLSEMVSKNRQY